MKKSLLVLNLFFLMGGRAYASKGMEDLFKDIRNMSELSQRGALYKPVSSTAVPKNIDNQKKEETRGEQKSKSSTGAGKLKSNMRSNNRELELLQQQVEQNKIDYLEIQNQKEVIQAQLTETQLQLAAVKKNELEIQNKFKQLLEQNKKLGEERQGISELQTTPKSQQEAIAKKEEERQQLERQIASLKQTLESMQSQKSVSESQIAELTQKFSDAKKVAGESNDKANQLSLELKQLRKEKEENSSEVEKLTQKIQNLKKVKKEYEDSAENFSKKEAEFEAAEQKHAEELEALRQKYNDSADALKQQLADKENMVQELQVSLEVAKSSRSTSAEERNERLEQELRKTAKLQADLKSQHEAIAKKEEERQQLEEQMTKLKRELKLVQNQKSESELQIEELTKNFSEAEKVAEESKNKADKLSLELKQLQKENEEKSSAVEELTLKIQDLEMAQKEYEVGAADFSKKEASFKAAERKHNEDMSTLQQKYNGSANNLLQIKQQLADKENVIKQLQNSLEVAKSNQSTSGADDLLKRIVELEVGLNTKNELVDEYQMRNEQMKRDLESRKTENEASPADQETLVTTKFDDDASLVSLDQVSNGSEEGALNLVEYLLGQLNKTEKNEITFKLDQLRDLVSKISEFESNLIEENNELRQEAARLAEEANAQGIFVDQNWGLSLDRDLYKSLNYVDWLLGRNAELREKLREARGTENENSAVDEVLEKLEDEDSSEYRYLRWLKDRFDRDQEANEEVGEEGLREEPNPGEEDSHEPQEGANSYEDQRSTVSNKDMTEKTTKEELRSEAEGGDELHKTEQPQENQKSGVGENNAQTTDAELENYEEDRGEEEEEAQELFINREDFYGTFDTFCIVFDYINLLRNNCAIWQEALSLVHGPQKDSGNTSLDESDNQEEQQQEEFFEHLKNVVEELKHTKKAEFLDRRLQYIEAVTGQNEDFNDQNGGEEEEEEAEDPAENLNESQITENNQDDEIEEEEEDKSSSQNRTELQNDDSDQFKNSDTNETQNEATEGSINQVGDLSKTQPNAPAEEASSKSADLLNAMQVVANSKEADKSRLLDALSVNNKLAYATLYCLYCYQSTLFNRQAGNQCALTPEEEGAAKEFCKRALSRNEDFPNSDGSMYGLLNDDLNIYNSGVMDAVLAINGDQDKRDAVWSIVNKYLSK